MTTKDPTLKQLQEKWGEKWDINQTPKGVFVAIRHRHFVLTPTRVDQGFRFCLIEETAKEMDTRISEQEKLASSLTMNGA